MTTTTTTLCREFPGDQRATRALLAYLSHEHGSAGWILEVIDKAAKDSLNAQELAKSIRDAANRMARDSQ